MDFSKYLNCLIPYLFHLEPILQVCGGDAPYMSSADLAAEHERCYKEAIKLFKATRKMGGAEFSEQFLERLDIDIEACFVFCIFKRNV